MQIESTTTNHDHVLRRAESIARLRSMFLQQLADIDAETLAEQERESAEARSHAEALLWERCNSEEAYGKVPDEWLSVVVPGDDFRLDGIAKLWEFRVEVGWEAICIAHNYCCLYCNRRTALAMDHVHPRKLGGEDVPHNIAPACQRCNSSKGAKPMAEWLRSRGSAERWQIALRWLTARPDLPIPAGVLPE